MERSIHFPKGRGRILAFLMVMTFAYQGVAQAVLTPVGHVTLSEKQSHYFSEQTRKGTVSAHEFVEVDAKSISGTSVTITAFGKSFTLHQMYTNERGPRDYSWFGRSHDGYGSAVFVVNGDMVTAHMTLDFGSYSLMPLGEGLHVMMAINESAFPHDENDGRYAELVKTAGPPKLDYIDYDNDPIEAAQPKSINNCSIRYLIAYTTAVGNALADVHGFMQSCIDNHNLINANSTGEHNVELARSVLVNYNEVGGEFGTDLSRFKGTADGFMDNIHSLRTLYDADVCQLIVNFGDACGLADAIGASFSTAFAVTERSCAVSNKTFTHETGHLYGARHDPFIDANIIPIPYAHGYVKTAGTSSQRWRTVMAYVDQCESLGATCPRLERWSNPSINVTFNGTTAASGTFALHNNAEVVRDEESTLSGFEARITNKNVTNNTVLVDEWGNIEGGTSITAPSVGSTSVVYNSGSKGNYRAGTSITLLPGFWARAGTDFVAYIGTCSNPQYIGTPNDYVITSEEVVEKESGESELADAGTTASTEVELGVHIFPNPFSENTFIEVACPAGAEVKITVLNLLGVAVLQPYAGQAPDSGVLRIEAQMSELASGIYLVSVQAGAMMSVQRVVKNK
jgi:hypothetical protein